MKRIPPHIGWPLLVVCLLGFTVVINVILVMKATNDPSFAVEEDYYQKAVNWDEQMAERRESDALGWTVELQTAPADSAEMKLIVLVKDRDGRPISDGAVLVTARHNARSNRPVTASLDASPDGGYRGPIALIRPGLWQFDVEVTRNDDRYRTSVRRDILQIAAASGR